MPRAEREAQILDAAALEFGQRGYASTTIALIAERANISKPLIHAYFDSKEGLYCACVSRAGEELIGRVDQALAEPSDSPTDRAVGVLHAIFVALEPRPHDWKVLHDATLPQGSAASETARRYRALFVEQGAMGVSGSVADRVQDSRDLSFLVHVWTNVVTAMVNWWLRNPDQSAQQMTERSRHLFELLFP